MAFKMKRWGGYQNSPLKQDSPITDDMLTSRREKAPWRFGSSEKRGISDADMRVILEKELIRKTKKQYKRNARLKEEDRQDILWNPHTESYILNPGSDNGDGDGDGDGDGNGDGNGENVAGGTRTWQEGVSASNGQLDKWVAERKKHTKGSDEWKRLQNLINEALGNSKRY